MGAISMRHKMCGGMQEIIPMFQAHLSVSRNQAYVVML